ncbi:MAG: TonB-dependent receptor [Candidatus Marinimicrobia bacterium]|nr:TonB-dependent receptor [Candidatus Neomarinimicrobiota bacterium]MCF7880237.1 TonB-dependent receptor [Candidatus Neomarinimicrobiota bacterium]
MNKKLLFITLLVIGMVPHLFGATTGKISGTVTDAETGEPLVGANVVVDGTDQGAATDAEGEYFILNVPPGTYSVTVSMMGYARTQKTDVRVTVDHTSTVNFELESSAITGEAVEITATAQRDVIQFDMSASQISVGVEEVTSMPSITNMEGALTQMVGVDVSPTSSNPDVMVRGGGRGQNLLMVDGQTMVDNQSNRPMFNMINLSAVQSINVVKGGFNAEYGNVRSGVINVVTKNGPAESYSGSIDMQYTPAHYKHRGYSIFDHRNYFLRPYLDPEVAFVGTAKGWEDKPELREQYNDFGGWNQFAQDLAMSPEEAQKMFMWRHRAEGVEDFEGVSRQPGSYGDIPDYNIDASFGGPVPFISDPLGDLRFFASHRTSNEAFGLPTIRDYFSEKTSQLKLTSSLTTNMKLTVEGLYGETNTVSSAPRASGMDQYMVGGNSILYSPIATGYDYVLGQNGSLYYPSALNPFDIYTSMVGLSFEHVLSQSTFYNIRISQTMASNVADTVGRPRSDEVLRYFGDVPVGEEPLGYEVGIMSMFDGMDYTGEGATRDYSDATTFNFKFDLVSQINNNNQIKTGIDFTYDDLNIHYEHNQPGDVGNNWVAKSRKYPHRFGAYLQNKLEFQGMIANVGLRADYLDPNAGAYSANRYSDYFKKEYRDSFESLVPTEEAETKINLSPRLGISHPIAETAKLYFNYGHFYSNPTSNELYTIRKDARGTAEVGNADLQMQKTIAYELGVEYSLFNAYMLHLSGYYKDITQQINYITFEDYTGAVDYGTYTNNNYQDIKGFEVRLEKRFGQWVTGWVNYDYMVVTTGYVGRANYFEDPRRQRLEGLTNPYQERPLPEPVAQANLRVMSPDDFGPALGGMNPLGGIQASLLYSYRSGDYFTYPQGNPEENNVQWKARQNADLRFNKRFNFENYSVGLFVDIANVFDFKYLETSGFASAQDYNDYMESLHLPLYGKDAYADNPDLVEGDDQPGDYKQDYINMPNREFLTFFNPRTVTLGLRVNF